MSTSSGMVCKGFDKVDKSNAGGFVGRLEKVTDNFLYFRVPGKRGLVKVRPDKVELTPFDTPEERQIYMMKEMTETVMTGGKTEKISKTNPFKKKV